MPNTSPTDPLITFDTILLANPQLRGRITYRDQERASPSIALDWVAVVWRGVKRVGRFAVRLVEGSRVRRRKRANGERGEHGETGSSIGESVSTGVYKRRGV